jgi:hypothetical protein
MTHNFVSTDQIVFVVVYRHRHGEDVKVFGDERAADAWVENVIRQYVDDLGEDDDIARVLAHLDGGDLVEAMNLWGDLAEESFDIDSQDILVLRPTAAETLGEMVS